MRVRAALGLEGVEPEGREIAPASPPRWAQLSMTRRAKPTIRPIRDRAGGDLPDVGAAPAPAVVQDRAEAGRRYRRRQPTVKLPPCSRAGRNVRVGAREAAGRKPAAPATK
jgi:hypothetical protein